MIIRDERADDADAIASVIADAFAGVAHSDQSEPAIVARLRADGDLAVSLVAEEEGAVIGHVAFSLVTIEGQPGRWFGLGPVSVAPSSQNRGIGATLIEAGINRLRETGAEGCVVLGNLGYYARFGFARDDRLRYEEAPPEYFAWQGFDDTDWPVGRVAYARAFSQ